jgi:L-glyceraldehyde 3-phosphate reductase
LEANLAALDMLAFSDDELDAIDQYATDAGVNLWAASSSQ